MLLCFTCAFICNDVPNFTTVTIGLPQTCIRILRKLSYLG